MLRRDFFDRFDLLLLLCTLGLAAFGALMVKSATGSTEFVSEEAGLQPYWIACGVAIMIMFWYIDFRRLAENAMFIYVITIVMLVAVLFLGTGAGNVDRWIPLGAFHLQPSELAKLSLIICTATYLSRSKTVRFQDILAVGAMAVTPLALILLQPNLGTATVLVAIAIGILFVAGISVRWMVILTLVCLMIGYGAVDMHILKEYQLERLAVFISPDTDPLGAGYNLAQSKIAVGSGGFDGKGLYQGTQSHLNFLPARHTDFIFAVIGEELGFAGSATIVIIYLILLNRGLRIARRCTDRCGALMAAGIVSMFVFQVFVNIGMTVGIMPITGLPLPFISYGGSAMITDMAAVGLLLSINWRYRPRGFSLTNGHAGRIRFSSWQGSKRIYE